MRDLDIRGAGNLLGDEQSGHVAAVGFELYCQMIDEAVAELQRDDAEAARGAASRSASTSPSTPTCRPAYVPFEAAKIDIHRRIVAARAPGRAAGDPRRARATASGRCRRRPRTCWRCSGRGSSSASPAPRSVEFRGGRLSVTGVELDSEQAEKLREGVEGAIYEWREQTAALRVPDEPEARLAAVLALAEGLARGARTCGRICSRPREGEPGERSRAGDAGAGSDCR